MLKPQVMKSTPIVRRQIAFSRSLNVHEWRRHSKDQLKSNLPAQIKTKSYALVVDDCASTLLLHCHYLESMGFTVVSATSAEAALELCKGVSFDIMLMDVSLPGMNGTDAAQKIRKAEGINCPKQIVFCSGYAPEDYDVSDCDVMWLTKPVSKKNMIRQINNLRMVIAR